MDQEPIIPTRLKRKLPRTLSYPVGAKAISEALVGVPQFDDLTLRFWFYHQRGSRAVLEAEFRGPFRSFSASSESMDIVTMGWTITIGAVPRSLRHLIQGKILSEALPSIRTWLISNPHSLEREGYNAISFSFDKLKNELTCEERATADWKTTRVGRPS